MKKNLFKLLPLFLAVLMANTATAQDIETMMGQYADQLSPEKIHLHFDKTVYNKGETIWYKAYILQRGDTSSQNIYLEWYGADGKLLSQTVAPLLLSTSQGSFDIPADYKGGSLQVRAFTKWMLNDDPVFAYQRQLMINGNNAGTARPAAGKTTVATFPEGGFLIQGLHTRIAFKATNQLGHPVFIRGVLTDGSNNVLDSLKVKHDGMGSFYLIPLPGQTYQLNWTDETGATGTTPIPVTKNSGARLTVQAKNGKALFQVQRTEEVPESFKQMNLLVHMNQVLLYNVAINTAEKTILNSEVPIASLPTGLLQFTLFSSEWIPVAERVLFVNNGLHVFDVQVTAPQVNFDKRAKNVLEVFVPDTLFTNMSIAITDADVNPPAEHTIFSDVLLSSELRGKIHDPGYYFSGKPDSVAADLDLVMLTNGWRRFDWEKIRAGVPPKISYPIENSYMGLHGKVSGLKKNGPPVELNFIIVKDSTRQFITVPVMKDGSFEHPAVFFDTAKVFYSFNNNPSLSDKVKMEIDNGLLSLPPKNIKPENTVPFKWNDSLASQRLNTLLSEQELLAKMMAETTLKEVTVTTRVKTKEEKLDEKYASGFFGGPGKKSYIFDLTDPNKPNHAQNVLEYLQSKVPGLDILSSGLSYQVRWRGDAPEFYLNEMRVDALTILGVSVMDIAMIKAIPPLFMFATGGGRGGAIAVYTKKGDDYPAAVLKGLPGIMLTGYSKFREFYSPAYDDPNETTTQPDRRTTLYWSPNLITNQTLQRMRIEFFNNDFTKAFNVVLEGINADGKMVRIVKRLGN